MTPFWQNFFSTLLAGTILGAIAAYFVTKFLSNEEKRIRSGEEQLFTEKKRGYFLTFIQKEIQEIIDSLKANNSKYQLLSTLPYVHFNTSYWEVLKSSGDIPMLFEPTTLEVVTTFYFHVEQCNFLYEQLLTSFDAPDDIKRQFLYKKFKEEINYLYSIIKYFAIEEIVSQDLSFTESKKNLLQHLLRHNKENEKYTCREEILFTVRQIIKETGYNEFSPQDVIERMKKQKTKHLDSTIRTHITGLMCSNAPKNHAVKYNDFERVERGKYRLMTFD